MKNRKEVPKPSSDFYKRMLEAKEKKRKALEQKRIHDEFGDVPLPPQVVIKPENELKLDIAFRQLQEKLRAEHESQQPKSKLETAIEKFNEIEREI